MGCKAHLSAVKEACKFAERIHGVLAMAGRFEVAMVPETPDFFDASPGMAKARNLVWESVRNTLRLQWVILTRSPDLISSSLPPTWIGKGFQNVCIGYMADTDAAFAEKVQALRHAPVQHRMIHLTSARLPIDLHEHLQGIDWVVFAGNPEDAALAANLESACRQAGVAFLFHQTGGRLETSSDIGASEDGSSWPNHPFGTKIDLLRPTLPKLMVAHTTQSETAMVPVADQASASSAIASGPESIDQSIEPPGASEPAAEMMDFVVVASANSPPVPLSSTPFSGDAEHNDFTRLDGVVRRGLATFMEVGQALMEIRDRELWRAGGHPSWADYNRTVGGLTKVHANRLIRAAQIAQHLAGVEPIGFTPVAESQMRPLCRLQNPEQYTQAWSLGVERAGGGQPTAKQLTNVVAELMAYEPHPAKAKPNRKQLVSTTIKRLRKAVIAKRPPKEIEGIIAELEKLLRLV